MLFSKAAEGMNNLELALMENANYKEVAAKKTLPDYAITLLVTINSFFLARASDLEVEALLADDA